MEKRRPTAGSSRVIRSKLCHVVNSIIDCDPEIVGEIVLGKLLDGDEARHDGKGLDLLLWLTSLRLISRLGESLSHS